MSDRRHPLRGEWRREWERLTVALAAALDEGETDVDRVCELIRERQALVTGGSMFETSSSRTPDDSRVDIAWLENMTVSNELLMERAGLHLEKIRGFLDSSSSGAVIRDRFGTGGESSPPAFILNRQM